MARTLKTLLVGCWMAIGVVVAAEEDAEPSKVEPAFRRSSSVDMVPVDVDRARAAAQVLPRSVHRAVQRPAMKPTVSSDEIVIEGDSDSLDLEAHEEETEAESLYSQCQPEAGLAGMQAAADVVEEAGPGIRAAGVKQGFREAFNDREIGELDRTQGLDQGIDDPGAWPWGRQCGAETGVGRALEDAAAEVERRFRNLDQEPSLLVDVQVPSWSGCEVPVETPELSSLIQQNPGRWEVSIAPTLTWLGMDLMTFIRLPLDEDLSGVWGDVDDALQSWWADGSRSALCQGLPLQVRRDAEAFFREQFESTLTELDSDLDPEWEDGILAGWVLGAELKAELEFRQGVVEGFIRTADDAAALAFAEVYPAAYHRRFDEVFKAWETSVRAEVAWLEVIGPDIDGVLHPGDEVEVELEVVNFGGIGGEIMLRLDGAVLEPSGVEKVQVDRRSRLEVPSLLAQVRQDLIGRTVSVMDVRVGDSRRGVSLVIAPR